MGDTRVRSYVARAVVEFARVLEDRWARDLTEVRVDSGPGSPSQAVLRFFDNEHRLVAAVGARIGSPLTVSVRTGAMARVRIFTGEVVALATEVADGAGFTTVTAMNRGHRLARGRRIEAYTNMTIGQVVAKIAARNGLAVGPVDAEKAVVPHLAQPNLTDWEFLTHLAQERGLVLAVDGESLGLRRRPTAHGHEGERGTKPVVLRHRDNLVALRAGLSSLGQVGLVEVRGWDVKQKKALKGLASTAVSDAYGVGITPGDSVAAFTDRPKEVRLVVSRPFGTEPQVRAAALAVAADSTAGMAELDAEVYGTPRLRVGSVVTLEGIGPPFAGTYTVTACSHVLNGVDGYRTRVRMGAPPPPIVPSPPPMTGLGLAVGVVTDTCEPAPGQRGAVRVRLPWLSETYVTDWARTVQWGGERGGGVFSPETGDEVLVGFEHGRLDRPFVIGGLYNGKDGPTDHRIPLIDRDSGRVNRRSLCSREGDRLELLNVPDGARGVRMVSGDDKLTAYLDRGTTTIKLSAGEGSDAVTLTLDGSGSLSIDAGDRGELTLRAGTVSIEATGGELTLAGQKTTITGTPVHIN
ncbi:VgrG-related protein [Kitasatospora griseola]|uniref:VgrG-related protein n=1 Tax=Kitasatospora griseola TaxID=2064 RepID=UPI0036DD8C39